MQSLPTGRTCAGQITATMLLLRDMAYARKDADTLEALVGKSRWPYPTYSDLLFY